MNLLFNILSFSILLPVLTHFSCISAMHLGQNPAPFKRSKLENNSLETLSAAQGKAQYIAALDKALQEINEDGSTILHTAVAQGDLTLCHDLLARGADPLVQNNNGQSALHVAVECNNHVIVEQLKAGMPKEAKQERIIAALCSLHRLRTPKDIRHKVLSYLPELIIAYPSLCRGLISSEILTLVQLARAQSEPLLALLNLKDSSGATAYALAKSRNNGFMARLTKPLGTEDACSKEITVLIYGHRNSETKEN